ncbi:5-formyltetrahydrofolate cyclo-ligase [Thalassotalea atypica]|uniref:5-formyltetrahydrofolate cyclo-ligase n=1 Tax=Thalassotalea atypica TaxID=2054316 RepID=UPI0025746842|nr:5-formyltetrahydrofolate cyclo-ligase [Thalassotalea atypica]
MNDRLLSRQQLRKLIRTKRNALDREFQHLASGQLLKQLTEHPRFAIANTVALYLANDGELDLSPIVKWCWQQGKRVYLPILHPFSANHLLFTLYRSDQKMVANKFGILEPRLNKAELIPIKELDIICTPLVAFDHTGARLGMGGGFYDRTLAPIYDTFDTPSQSASKQTTPYLIGLAHDCQQIAKVPTESWDIPIPEIITPTQRIIC